MFASTGFEFCIDYCCDQIESIHIGEAEDSCHLGGCSNNMPEDCCSSEEVEFEQYLMDFTLAGGASLVQLDEVIAFNSFQILIYDPGFVIDQPAVAEDDVPIPRIEIRDLTQVNLC